jgi:hypothetical protein
MLVKFVSWFLSFELWGRVLVIATRAPTGFIYLALMLITDLARSVSFLSVSDSSVKVV